MFDKDLFHLHSKAMMNLVNLVNLLRSIFSVLWNVILNGDFLFICGKQNYQITYK